MSGDSKLHIFQYGNETIIQEHLGNGKVISRKIKGTLTDKYDGIKLKYKLFADLISLKEFFELIIGDRFEKKDRAMKIYRDYKHMKVCTNMQTVLKYAKNWASHFIPNTFYKWNDRSLENIRCVQWMVFDFELRKSNGQAFLPIEVYEIFLQTIGFAPTFVVPSKTTGNYHVYLHHTSINGSTDSTYLFKRIQSKIVDVIGTDSGAIGANHNFAIPRGKIFYFGDNLIDFNSLKEWWLGELRKENKNAKMEQFKANKVASLTEYQVWNHSAIKALLDCEFDGSRNEAGFTLALLFYALGKDKKECEEALLNGWFETVSSWSNKPFYRSELKASIKSAYSGKYFGPSREKIEGLTGKEFHIKIYRTQYIRTEKHNKKENQEAIFNFFRKHNGQVEMLKKDLIEAICATEVSPLGKKFSPKSIRNNLDKLKEEGIVMWEENGRGRNAKPSVFTFMDGIQSKAIIEHDNSLIVFGKEIAI